MPLQLIHSKKNTMIIIIAATAMRLMTISILMRIMTSITKVKNTSIIKRRSIITCTRKAGM